MAAAIISDVAYGEKEIAGPRQKLAQFLLDFGLQEEYVCFSVLLVKKLGCSHGETKRIYLNRALGGNRHYCTIDGDINAGTA